MRYDAEHKGKSRDRIVEAARALFRREGFDGASIDRVMKEAGLTRGAFYAHFESKDALIRDNLAIEAGLVRALGRAATQAEPRRAATLAIEGYLDPAERNDVATGCPLVAHPVDAVRGGAVRQEGYTAQLTSLVDALDEVIGSRNERDTAVLAAVLTVGAGLLSAASGDQALSDRISDACRAEIARLIGA